MCLCHPFPNGFTGACVRASITSECRAQTSYFNQILKSDSQIGAENFHSDISQNNVLVGPYDSP